MNRGAAVVAAALALTLAGCGGPDARGAADGAGAAGWIALFDGRSLDGWIPKVVGHPPGEDPDGLFSVRDGLLTVDYAGDFDGRFGHLFHEREWSHYRLRVEYRFTGEQAPGGPGWAWTNSGVMFHAQPPHSMRLDQDFPVSLELQFLGGAVGADAGARPTANLCTPGTHVEMGGALHTQHCTNSFSPTFRGDAWVTVELEVRGGELIRHLVDGQEVLAYARPILDDGDADARALLQAGRPAELTSGFLALQAESHPVQFRRIELLPFDG